MAQSSRALGAPAAIRRRQSSTTARSARAWAVVGSPIDSTLGARNTSGPKYGAMPVSGGHRRDTAGGSDEPVPSVAAGMDDILLAISDAPAELVAAEIFPALLNFEWVMGPVG